MDGPELFPGHCDHGESRRVSAERLERVDNVGDDDGDDERVLRRRKEHLRRQMDRYRH